MSVLHFKLCIFSTKHPCSVRLTGCRDAATSFHTCTHTHTELTRLSIHFRTNAHTHKIHGHKVCKFTHPHSDPLHTLANTPAWWERNLLRQYPESVWPKCSQHNDPLCSLCSAPPDLLVGNAGKERASATSHGPHTQVSVSVFVLPPPVLVSCNKWFCSGVCVCVCFTGCKSVWVLHSVEVHIFVYAFTCLKRGGAVGSGESGWRACCGCSEQKPWDHREKGRSQWRSEQLARGSSGSKHCAAGDAV